MGFLAPIITAIGTAVSVTGQIQAGNAQMDAARTNASNTVENAAIAEQQQRTQDRAVLARAHALVGTSGVELAGSPLDVLAESTRQAEMNALYIRRGGALTANSQLQSGAAAQKASRINAASTILTGGYRIGQQVADLSNTRSSNKTYPLNPNDSRVGSSVYG